MKPAWHWTFLWTCSCSVENPVASEDHDVERDRAEGEFAALRMITPGSERGTQQSFEHTVDGLDLPTLFVAREMQAARHPSPPESARLLCRRPPDQRWDERVDAALFAGVVPTDNSVHERRQGVTRFATRSARK